MNSTQSSELLATVVILFLVIWIVAGIRYQKKASKAKKAKKAELKTLQQNGLRFQGIFIHVNGLPIPEGTSCTVRSFADHLEFVTDSINIKLEKPKVKDISIKTDVEIQKQYVSSIGGAVGGAVLFGPFGAMIGGRAKEKKTKTEKTYLIFSYQKTGEEEMKFIGFDISLNLFDAQKFVNEFKKAGKVTSIEL